MYHIQRFTSYIHKRLMLFGFSAIRFLFWVAKISNTFLGFLKFLIFFGGER